MIRSTPEPDFVVLQPMRILHVSQSMEAEAGGPPAVVEGLSAAQARAGHRVSILSGTTRAGSRAAQAVDRIKWAGVRGELPTVVRQFDILHLHGVWDRLLRLAAAAARDAPRPYVIAPHGMLHPWSMRQRAFKKRVAMALFARRMLNGAAFLHLLNTDEASLIAPLGLYAPVEVLPNGIFLPEINPLPPAGSFYAAHPELGTQPYILFLGRLHYKKGLDLLAASFAAVAKTHADIQMVVAGADAGERESFRRQVANAGLSQRVHLVGPLYGRDKTAALVDAACFCLPSRQEGFSMAILEALACGTAVVVSETCYFPEVAEHGAGIVVPLDTAALAEALRQVISQPERARQMGRAGQELVGARYTWDRVAEQSILAYQKHRAPAPKPI